MWRFLHQCVKKSQICGKKRELSFSKKTLLQPVCYSGREFTSCFANAFLTHSSLFSNLGEGLHWIAFAALISRSLLSVVHCDAVTGFTLKQTLDCKAWVWSESDSSFPLFFVSPLFGFSPARAETRTRRRPRLREAQTGLMQRILVQLGSGVQQKNAGLGWVAIKVIPGLKSREPWLWQAEAQ